MSPWKLVPARSIRFFPGWTGSCATSTVNDTGDYYSTALTLAEKAVDGSDVDLLLLLDGEISPYTEMRRISEVVGRLALQSGYLLTVLPINEEIYRGSAKPFLENVRREGVPVTPAIAG